MTSIHRAQRFLFTSKPTDARDKLKGGSTSSSSPQVLRHFQGCRTGFSGCSELPPLLPSCPSTQGPLNFSFLYPGKETALMPSSLFTGAFLYSLARFAAYAQNTTLPLPSLPGQVSSDSTMPTSKSGGLHLLFLGGLPAFLRWEPPAVESAALQDPEDAPRT